jgi:hypothetical protein
MPVKHEPVCYAMGRTTPFRFLPLPAFVRDGSGCGPGGALGPFTRFRRGRLEPRKERLAAALQRPRRRMAPTGNAACGMVLEGIAAHRWRARWQGPWAWPTERAGRATKSPARRPSFAASSLVKQKGPAQLPGLDGASLRRQVPVTQQGSLCRAFAPAKPGRHEPCSWVKEKGRLKPP